MTDRLPFEQRYATQFCTRDEAFAHLRKAKAKTTVFIHAGSFVVTEDLGDNKQRGFDSSTNVKVSRKIAEKYIGDILSEKLQERGARLKIVYSIDPAEYAACLFIG